MAIGDPRSSAKRARDTVRSIKGTPSELRRDMIKKHKGKIMYNSEIECNHFYTENGATWKGIG